MINTKFANLARGIKSINSRLKYLHFRLACGWAGGDGAMGMSSEGCNTLRKVCFSDTNNLIIRSLDRVFLSMIYNLKDRFLLLCNVLKLGDIECL